ncbi:MAG: class I SAM-dependent rRNA methyltransferase [Marinilabiliales bacterium]
MRIKAILKSGKDQSVKRFHPWIFSGAIKKMDGQPKDGELIDVFSNKDEYLGTGHFQNGSIAIRLITFNNEKIDKDFWFNKITKAVNYRKSINIIDSTDTNAYRLIHAEGDNLPGLIVDYYNGTLVLQMHSVGMALAQEQITAALMKSFNDIVAIYDKSENTLPYFSDYKQTNHYILKKSEPDKLIKENSLLFYVDWEKGQKTGFFIDQRDNRKLVKDFAKDKKVLNLFGYTGGFSVYALAGKAKHVDTVDTSSHAIELANNNVELNFASENKHNGIVADAFDYLTNTNEKYDLIILDPPAFAKHNNVLHNALQGYKRLNQKALEIINPGGIIFTFSCSQVISKENFKKSVFAAAANSGRSVKIIKYLSQPPDHPVNIYHPESEYLKGLILYVE